ncbi:unnamed protein product [Phaeothamnion confervicola]
MRLSLWYPADDISGSDDFDRFVKSFKLVPISYREASTTFSDPRGISFTPPARWVRETPKGPFQAARFSNLTRSIVLLVSGNAGYTCRNFRAEVQSTGRLVEEAQIKLANQVFTKLMTYEDVPKYNVRLTNAQYCMDTRNGAIALVGTVEKDMYWRWASVFEGTAATLRAR